VGRLVEVGTPIRVTRRVVARNMVIQLYDCGIQYNGCLKVERHDEKQVVLLSSLVRIYQGSDYEEIQKYGGRDISESSCVFCGSKDCEALVTDHYFQNPQTKNCYF
jgi:hypothetical protein